VTRPTKAQIARAAREHQIVAAARSIAETEGWPAVTVRRLAGAIGYSQPVLYGHFPDGRDGILRAVAIEGFEQLATALTDAARRGPGPARLRAVAQQYLTFAREHPAVYDAMFSMPIGLAFATAEAPAPLQQAFAALETTVAAADADPETRAEVLWSALHGLAELGRHARLRPSHERARTRLLVELFS
jgi:AcrR family transcriptional regulator